MGAWIETLVADAISNITASHPEWVRGLKHRLGAAKQWDVGRTSSECVDWNVDACNGDAEARSRTPCGCVDWNVCNCARCSMRTCRTPCGCVDWNQLVSKCKIEHCGYCYTWAELSIFLVPIGALWWYRFMRYSGTDLPILSKTLAKSVYFSLFNSEIEWNIRENL